MKLLRSQHPPPEFDAVHAAFQLARQQPATVPFLRIGLLNEAGDLAATGYLDGAFQVETLAQQLAPHGYEQMTQASALQRRLCDVLFVPSAVRARDSLRGELEAN